MAENWLPVPGLVGSYEVSDEGRVRSLDRRVPRGHGSYLLKGRILKGTKIGKGYLWVPTGSRHGGYVHRLVMEAFVGPCPEGMEVCHNNGCSTDNRLENLRYDTPANNNRDKARHGTDYNANKTHCPRGHAYSDENTYRTKNGGRECRTCTRAKNKQAGRKKRATPEGRAGQAAYVREWRRRTGRVDGLGNQWTRRTSCDRGHPFTPENTHTRSDGGRRCRACMREQDRRRRPRQT